MIFFALILGLLVGFYARSIYDMIKIIYDDYIERKQAQGVGVVQPNIQRGATRNQPINLQSDSGVVHRPNPHLATVQAIKEREKKMKNL